MAADLKKRHNFAYLQQNFHRFGTFTMDINYFIPKAEPTGKNGCFCICHRRDDAYFGYFLQNDLDKVADNRMGSFASVTVRMMLILEYFLSNDRDEVK